MCDLRLKTLGAQDAEKMNPEAKQLVSWLESGAFDALRLGYLEKAVLVISNDEAASSVIEAWDLSVAWKDGTPSLVLASSDGAVRKSGAVAAAQAGKRVTKSEVRSMSQMVLRQLMIQCQSLNTLPPEYWIGMQLLYREGHTPREYEPQGFGPATAVQGGLLRFDTRPIKLDIGPKVDAGATELRLKLILPEGACTEGIESQPTPAASEAPDIA